MSLLNFDPVFFRGVAKGLWRGENYPMKKIILAILFVAPLAFSKTTITAEQHASILRQLPKASPEQKLELIQKLYAFLEKREKEIPIQIETRELAQIIESGVKTPNQCIAAGYLIATRQAPPPRCNLSALSDNAFCDGSSRKIVKCNPAIYGFCDGKRRRSDICVDIAKARSEPGRGPLLTHACSAQADLNDPGGVDCFNWENVSFEFKKIGVYCDAFDGERDFAGNYTDCLSLMAYYMSFSAKDLINRAKTLR